jgi:hypothetical protein
MIKDLISTIIFRMIEGVAVTIGATLAKVLGNEEHYIKFFSEYLLEIYEAWVKTPEFKEITSVEESKEVVEDGMKLRSTSLLLFPSMRKKSLDIALKEAYRKLEWHYKTKPL